MTEDRELRRATRLARQRQLRRRRLGAFLVAGVVLAGLVFGLVRAFGGSGGGTGTEASSTRSTVQSSQKTTTSQEHRRGNARKRLEQRGDKAVARFAKLGLPLYCGGTKGRYVALTFDDGPGPYTERYAFPILRQAKVRATWFVVGRNIANWPTLPRRELAFGAVGDHTWTHAYLPGLDFSAMRSELASTQTELERSTGKPVRLFRPPYGARNATIDRESRALGMLEVLWSIDSLDSQGADFNGITKQVLDNVRSGSIVLFHENRGQTIRALKFHILPELRHRHFKTVSLPELLALDPPTLKQLKAATGGC
ncbi:MAG TPA: polysaccharide deacetylase family protein [Gaiellaceae bacterium]